MSSIAYIAGLFPARSETFVYREVRALRARGWNVQTISLNNPKDPTAPEFADLLAENKIVYGSQKSATLLAIFAECLLHPIRSTRTLFTAASDALAPRDPTPLCARLKFLAQAFAAIGAAHRIAKAHPAHIHAHFAHAPATVGMYAAIQLGIPFSFTGHANDIFQRRVLLTKKLSRASFVACISEWHRDFYKQFGVDPAKCRVIRCGVPVNEWKPRPAHDFGPTLNILTVCRLVPKKGVDTLLRALREFAARSTQNWRLTIAGDGEQMNQLKTLATELNIAAQCNFLGAVTNDHVRELLGQADVFSLPCKDDANGDRDGIPVVLMEAMACGVPVISGDLPAIRELITHRESGMLVDGTKPTEVADALNDLVTDTALRAKIISNARTRVETEFSLDENVTRLIETVTWASGPCVK
jgi:colanic acid/amylovoran biosynthesis glycosyltransferase